MKLDGINFDIRKFEVRNNETGQKSVISVGPKSMKDHILDNGMNLPNNISFYIDDSDMETDFIYLKDEFRSVGLYPMAELDI